MPYKQPTVSDRSEAIIVKYCICQKIFCGYDNSVQKIIPFICLVIFAFVAFFVIDVYQTLSDNPNTTYGHLILRDRT